MRNTLVIAPALRFAPWHVMGTNLTVAEEGEHLTVEEALARADMDYTVTTAGIEQVVLGPDVDVDRSQFPDWRAVVRRRAGEDDVVLGVTGTRFRPVQNADAFAVADYLTSEFGAQIVTATDYHHGRSSLLVVDLNRPANLRPSAVSGGDGESLPTYLLINNAHDGTGALTMALTMIRPACTNAVQVAVRKADRVWRIRHTMRAGERLNLARQAMLASMQYVDEFEQEAQRMMDSPLSDGRFEQVVSDLWPVKVDQQSGEPVNVRARHNLETREQVLALYRHSPTLDGVRGTRWGGYSAVTEWIDHYRPVRGNVVVSRAEGALVGPAVKLKDAVWRRFSVTV